MRNEANTDHSCRKLGRFGARGDAVSRVGSTMNSNSGGVGLEGGREQNYKAGRFAGVISSGQRVLGLSDGFSLQDFKHHPYEELLLVLFGMADVN